VSLTDHIASMEPTMEQTVLDWPLARGCPMAPPPVLDALRHRPPVRVRIPAGVGAAQHAWLIIRNDDVRNALKDPRLSADEQRPGFPLRFQVPADDRPSSFLRMDDPDHARLRRMIATEFTARRVQALRPALQQLIDTRVDRLLNARAAGAYPVDLVASFAVPVPALVIARLLGVRQEDSAFFLEQTRIMIAQENPAESLQAHQRIVDFLDRTARRKENDPGDDLISRLIQRHLVTGDLTRQEFLGMLKLVLAAGHETTANQIGLSILSLLLDDRLRADVLADGCALMPQYIEESMRYWSIAQDGVVRQATEDLDIAGVHIRTGESVMLSIPGANHDAGVFADPLRIDIHRTTGGHVQWGHGPHHCQGAPLARLEMDLALRTLFTRLPGLRLACDAAEIRYRRNSLFHGVEKLPVTW
jgi:cytochrome P450